MNEEAAGRKGHEPDRQQANIQGGSLGGKGTATVYSGSSNESLEARFLQLEAESVQTKFLELEYNTLRKEIESGRERGFRIIVGAVLVVPAAQFVTQTFNVSIFKLFLPLLVICFYLLYLAEDQAIRRCAYYIRTNIEERIPKTKGWETWLKEEADRAHEKQLKIAFNALSVLFYAAATLIAATAPLDKEDELLRYIKDLPWLNVPPVGWSAAVIGSMYLLLGLVAAIFISGLRQSR